MASTLPKFHRYPNGVELEHYPSKSRELYDRTRQLRREGREHYVIPYGARHVLPECRNMTAIHLYDKQGQ